MRAVILLLAAAVVGLAASIVMKVDTRRSYLLRTGPLFHVGALVADARAGEQVRYRETTSGRMIDYKVDQVATPSPEAPPAILIHRILRDPTGRPYDGPTASVSYHHDVTADGFLPLTAPEAPQALDRVWIIRAIHRGHVVLHAAPRFGQRGQAYDCWRVDCIDPALPPGKDTVVCWVDERVPVYGLLAWKRAGETWELISGAFPPAGKKP
jgi:hypothetical protein